MDFGNLGAWVSSRRIDDENAGEAAGAAAAAGFGTLWLGDMPRLADLRPLLEGSEKLIVGTSIVNIWAHDPADVAREFAALEADFPGCACVGIGVGNPEADGEYRRPLSSLGAFLDRIEDAIPPGRRITAALGPRMLALSARRSLGTIPYFTSVEHTRFARETVGPDALVIPELACVLDEDTERARATARAYAATYLGLGNYTRALLAHGLGRGDIEGGGSDRLIDAVIPHGTADQIAAVARAHLDAGADQVALQVLGEEGVPAEGWAALAAALR